MMLEKPPERIFLQYHGDGSAEPGPVDEDSVTWCIEQIFDSDVEYTLSAPPACSPAAELDRLRAFRDFFNDRCEALFAEFGMEAVDLYNATEPYSNRKPDSR